MNELTGKVIGAAILVHRRIGPGLLESAYKSCLSYELTRTELDVRTEVPIPLVYDDVKLNCGYRADIIVDRKLIIEVKAVEAINNIHLVANPNLS